MFLGGTGSGKTTLKNFLTGNLTYRATQRTRVCEVREACVRFELTNGERNLATTYRGDFPTNTRFFLEWEEEGKPIRNEDPVARAAFDEKLQVAAARKCQVYDVGGEYTYQHLVNHLPAFDDPQNTSIVITISMTPDAQGVKDQLYLWIDLLMARRGSQTETRVMFVGTQGQGTVAEMSQF